MGGISGPWNTQKRLLIHKKNGMSPQKIKLQATVQPLPLTPITSPESLFRVSFVFFPGLFSHLR